MVMYYQDLLKTLRLFDTFTNCLQRTVEEPEFYGTRDPAVPVTELVTPAKVVPVSSLNEKLFKALFSVPVDNYITPELLEKINNLQLGKGSVVGSDAVFKYTSVDGTKVKLPCRVSTTSGLDTRDILKILDISECIISELPPRDSRHRPINGVDVRNKFLERLLCRFVTNINAMPEVWHIIDEETGEQHSAPRIVLKSK